MYFLGFSRYSNWKGCQWDSSAHRRSKFADQGALIPCDALGLVRVGVSEAFDLAGLASEEAVQVRADLVASVCLKHMALGASRLRWTIRSNGVEDGTKC